MTARLLLVSSAFLSRPAWALDPIHTPMAVSSIQVAITILLVTTWFIVAVWAMFRSRKSTQRARAARAWALRLRALIATTPGAYLVATGDVAVGSESLRGWLSLDQRISSLDQLAPDPETQSGLCEADYLALSDDIKAARASGAAFTRMVRPLRGERMLLAEGRLAPPQVAGDSSVVIWFLDQTEAQSHLLGLRAERDALQRQVSAATALLEAAPFPVWRRNAELKLQQVNSAYVRAVEAADADAVIHQALELISSASAPAPDKSAKQARDLKSVLTHIESAVIAGKRRALRVIEVPLEQDGVGGFAIDITESEEARADLSRHVRAHNETLNQLSSGVAIFGPDRTLVFHNTAFVRLFDLHNERLDDRPPFSEVLDHMRERRRLPEQRDFPAWKRDLQTWFVNILEPLEETWVLSDETVLRVVVQPHPMGGLTLVFEDQSEQLHLATARDSALKAYQATLNQLHEAVAVFSTNGRLKLYNSGFANHFALTLSDLSDEPHVDTLSALVDRTVSPDSKPRQLSDIVRHATVGRRAVEGRLALSNGETLDYRAVPLPNGDSLITYLDVTDSQRIERALRDRSEALEAADKLKSQFVSNMSYELRTPLTSITGFAQMLDQGYHGTLNNQQADYVRSILLSAERLQLLISDILDLAVTEAGSLVLETAELSIAELLKSSADMVDDQMHANALSFVLDVAPSAGIIEADERRLKQTIYNLLMNSIRFTPPGGTITVRAAGNEDGVTIDVVDTGIGIDEHEQEKVFERFQRGSNVPHATGVGLGLSLVRQFVALHGGTVSLTSSPGIGTTVQVILPRTVPADAWMHDRPALA